MASTRQFELDDLINRPGTYFNPQTEVLIVVDDSPELDTEVLQLEPHEGADWVLISDETPVDERRRDELLERFQVAQQPDELTDEDDAPLDDLDDGELEPDEEH